MRNVIRFSTAAAAVALALTMASAASAGGYGPTEDYGEMGMPDIYNRVITITPQTKWVNVNQGEDVKFVDTATGQSFVWNFDTTNPVFDLATVAPAGALGDQHVMAYVQENHNDES